MTYVSEWCRDRIAPALSPEAAARMQRLSPGVDTDRFYPGCGGAEVRERLGIPQDAPVVVCTARMIKRKGQDTLVKAWPAVLAELPDARLLLVGDGPNRTAVERLAARLGVSDSVIFTGGVPWDEVPAYTDAGDVFAMPCRTRLFGLGAGGLRHRLPGGAGLRATRPRRRLRGCTGSAARWLGQDVVVEPSERLLSPSLSGLLLDETLRRTLEARGSWWAETSPVERFCAASARVGDRIRR